MKRIAVVLALVLAAGLVHAQVSAPNNAGVSFSHLHFRVNDVEANKAFWVALGGKPVKFGATEVVKIPGVLIFLAQADPLEPSEGSVLDHIGVKVQNIAAAVSALRDRDLMVPPTNSSTVVNSFMPSGDRVELFAELTENAKFTLDPGQVDPSAERHNIKMSDAVTSHHIHIYTPEGADGTARDWYVKNFGATPGTRFHYKAADVPGMNLNFLGSEKKLAPTKGRTLDHIGFEVKNLEAFCKTLQANGVKFDMPYTRRDNGLALAFLTDPWGTYIELTEGLSGL